MNDKILNQILKVRDTGKTNMVNSAQVQVIADQMGFYELVLFIEEHPKEYLNFIIYGK